MIIKIVLILFIVSTAFAHQTGLSYIKLDELINKTIHIEYKKPLSDMDAEDIVLNFQVECKQTVTSSKNIKNGYIIKNYSLDCGENGLYNTRIWVDGLVASDRGVLLEYESQDLEQKSLLLASKSFLYIEQKNSGFALFSQYVSLGVHHILLGYDHLLFILALLLLARNVRVLLFAITAFTLSHSITLALAIFDIVNISVSYIEAMIALSIVFLARELIIVDKSSLTRKHLEIIAFTFGLLHGFGFSNVLKNIGLADNDIGLGLFSFNLGIELGQLLFIFVMILLFAAIKKSKLQSTFVERSIAYIIAVISIYWFIERVSQF